VNEEAVEKLAQRIWYGFGARKADDWEDAFEDERDEIRDLAEELLAHYILREEHERVVAELRQKMEDWKQRVGVGANKPEFK
jgi:hypothetical protein